MPSLGYRLAGSLAIVATLVFSGCAQHGNGSLPVSPQAVALPDRTPPSCKGQVDKSDYATLTGKLKTAGGSFCIPAYGGFGGNLKYPSLSPSIQLTVSSGTENFDNFPTLGSGTPIFYLAFSTSGGTTFGKDLKSGGGLTGKQIVSGQPYTAYGEAVVFGDKVKFGPCSTTATKGKYGGVIGGIGTLLKSEDIPFKVSGIIEIYSGEQTSAQC
ncbi:MAG: hypothetical protein WA215_13575 [Candidatus Cybelea sp.]